MYRRDSISIVQENLKDLWHSDVTVKNSTENESFNIVWRITNFTMCKLRKGEYIESPVFVAECLQNTNWHLRLYPRGEFDCDDVLCYLIRGNSLPDSITVRYQLSVGISSKIIDKVQTFEKYSQSAVQAVASRIEILNEVRKYPLVDILLVDCHIWNCQTTRKKSNSNIQTLVSYLHNHECNADKFPQEILYSTMDEMEALKRLLRPYPGSCSAYTRIPVERWYFLWTIKRFSGRQPNEKETITVGSVSASAPKILMIFFVNEAGFLEMSIRELTGKYETSFTLNCKIQLVGIHERNFEFPQEMHLFSPDEIWKVLLNIKQSDIIEQDKFLLDDKLTFRCELALSYENEVSNIDSCSYTPNVSILNNERQISHDRFTVKYLNSAWNHLKFASVICVISFLITFIYDTLTQMYW